jgi:hypothetical protein
MQPLVTTDGLTGRCIKKRLASYNSPLAKSSVQDAFLACEIGNKPLYDHQLDDDQRGQTSAGCLMSSLPVNPSQKLTKTATT